MTVQAYFKNPNLISFLKELLNVYSLEWIKDIVVKYRTTPLNFEKITYVTYNYVVNIDTQIVEIGDCVTDIKTFRITTRNFNNKFLFKR